MLTGAILPADAECWCAQESDEEAVRASFVQGCVLDPMSVVRRPNGELFRPFERLSNMIMFALPDSMSCSSRNLLFDKFPDFYMCSV